jgi:hypothetical protein
MGLRVLQDSNSRCHLKCMYELENKTRDTTFYVYFYLQPTLLIFLKSYRKTYVEYLDLSTPLSYPLGGMIFHPKLCHGSTKETCTYAATITPMICREACTENQSKLVFFFIVTHVTKVNDWSHAL